MQIKDLIRELNRVPASERRPSPNNWRTHPTTQDAALKAILARVGWADAFLVREGPKA